MKDSTIDLDGAVIGAVTRRATHVAVHLPRVTLRARSASGVEVDHSVELEMRVWGGTVEQHPQRLPRSLSDWGLYHAGGKRSGPLPASFSASGNLQLVFAFDADESLVITGSRLTLRLLKRPLNERPARVGPYVRHRVVCDANSDLRGSVTLARSARSFDLVPFGATDYTGRLVAERLARGCATRAEVPRRESGEAVLSKAAQGSSVRAACNRDR